MKRRTKIWLVGLVVLPLYLVFVVYVWVADLLVEYINETDNALKKRGY